MSIIDTDDDVTYRVQQLKADGIDTVIRYISTSAWKRVTANEAMVIRAAGLKLGLVYEDDGHPSGSAIGTVNGQFAAAYAKSIGAPTDGSAVISYAFDYDPGPSDLDGAIDAQRAFVATISPSFVPGSYASGWLNGWLHQVGLTKMRWITQSMGFQGTRAAISQGNYELLQKLPATIEGLDTDPDVMHIANGNIGAFVPLLVAGTTLWVQIELAKFGFQTTPDGISGLQTESAIKAFQVAHGLVADGIAGPNTVSALQGMA